MTEKKDDFIRIKDIAYICATSWKFFAVSLIIALSIAFLYLLVTPAKYTTQASLLIKEESKGGAQISNETSPFSDFGFYNVNTNVNNEIITIKSPAVIYETIKRLHLETSYKTKHLFKDRTLYGESLPIYVIIDGIEDKDYCSFSITPNGDDVELDDIVINGEKIDEPCSCKIGGSAKAGKALITVLKTAFYDKNFSETIHVQRKAILSATEECKNKLTVRLEDDKSSIINLRYEDVNYQRAEDFLNTLIAVYNENWIKDKNQIAISTSKFINERLSVIEHELGNVDNDISSYKSTHLIPDVEAASSMYMSQANQTNNLLLNLENQLAMTKYVQSIVNDNTNKDQLLPANIGVGNDNIERQITEYNSLQLQRNRLVANSSEKNPLVSDLDNSISAMRKAIITSINGQISTLQTQISSFERSKRSNTEKIASNPTQAKYLLSVERQQKVKEALYLYLLQKREENELSQAFTAYNTRVITPPMDPSAPSSPIKRNVLLIALAAGILLPLIIILLKENLNTTIRSKKDIEGLDIPFVGTIPQYGQKKERLFECVRRKKGRKKKESNIYVKENGKDYINEAFRIVRTNIEFINNADNRKVTMVTSATPTNGKTFITLNLAISFAIKGRRVLMIDLDLRRASLSKSVGAHAEGMSEYLNGNVADWHEIITQKEIASNSNAIDLLPVGSIPPNPAELLNNNKLEALLDTARTEYDVILIDCPPAELVADTSIISKVADSTLFVIRANFVDKEVIPAIEAYYKEKKFKNMSIVLNGISKTNSYSGYDRYGYNYGYHYYAE
ncbi:MAG: polysaccharide biosynthesis tyrosine autokinase [Paludibacteraceae bacterium]|nr:polysaccharide biosynthesis tyrosine autokinase [Paludibacteraceae bacterium]